MIFRKFPPRARLIKFKQISFVSFEFFFFFLSFIFVVIYNIVSTASFRSSPTNCKFVTLMAHQTHPHTTMYYPYTMPNLCMSKNCKKLQ